LACGHNLAYGHKLAWLLNIGHDGTPSIRNLNPTRNFQKSPSQICNNLGHGQTHKTHTHITRNPGWEINVSLIEANYVLHSCLRAAIFFLLSRRIDRLRPCRVINFFEPKKTERWFKEKRNYDKFSEAAKHNGPNKRKIDNLVIEKKFGLEKP
jgi:hypothetical protein